MRWAWLVVGLAAAAAACVGRSHEPAQSQPTYARRTLDAAPPADAAADAAAGGVTEPADWVNAWLESDAAVEPRPQPSLDPCWECCQRDPLCTCLCPKKKPPGKPFKR